MENTLLRRQQARRWGVLLGILGGGLPPGSPYFRLKHVNFQTRFQTRPLKSKPVFRPGLRAEIIIMSSLLELERQQNNSSNSF